MAAFLHIDTACYCLVPSWHASKLALGLLTRFDSAPTVQLQVAMPPQWHEAVNLYTLPTTCPSRVTCTKVSPMHASHLVTSLVGLRGWQRLCHKLLVLVSNFTFSSVRVCPCLGIGGYPSNYLCYGGSEHTNKQL